MRSLTKHRILLTGLFCILACQRAPAEHPDSTLSKIQQRILLISHAASLFEIDPLILSAIIYTERTLNYDWRDDRFDIPLFKQLGRNSSIGFCQIKIKTAYYIEFQFNHRDQPYFPGKKWENLLDLSKSKQTLLKKIVGDSLNIVYAAAYLRMMQTRWKNAGYPIDDRPEILGTLYSTGLFHDDGSERLPHSAPESNEFGEKVRMAITQVDKLFED